MAGHPGTRTTRVSVHDNGYPATGTGSRSEKVERVPDGVQLYFAGIHVHTFCLVNQSIDLDVHLVRCRSAYTACCPGGALPMIEL